ncbi:MAG TPA: zf-HC2 domain-containing protein [Thermoanaerobaculia bacterium]|nr:zf-HC2 domain-containing protein [Thermoanaerobaculia bacterium]
MSDPKHDERHDTVWLLLPWYANGTLETAERLLVEDHLAGCPGCREEVARCNGLAAALRARPEIAPSPHPLQLARLMERLDANDAGDAGDAFDASDASHAIHADDAINARAATAINASGANDPINAVDAIDAINAIDAMHAINATAATEAGKAAAAGARARQRGASLFGGTPRLVRWALAGQLAALLLLATALAFGPARRQPAIYHTLSEPSAPAAPLPATSAVAAAPQIRVVFVEAATAKQMREVLLSTRGHLVDGPSPLGAYTLELPAPAAAAATPPAGGFRGTWIGDLAPAPPAPRASSREAAPDSVGIVLAYLRSQAIVRFAEPVAGTGTPAPAAPAPGTAAPAPQGVPGTAPEAPPS